MPYLGIADHAAGARRRPRLLKMPAMDTNDHTQDFRPGAFDAPASDSIWNTSGSLLGALGIFVYVGAEVSIGSFLINYFGSARHRRHAHRAAPPASSPTTGAAR